MVYRSGLLATGMASDEAVAAFARVFSSADGSSVTGVSQAVVQQLLDETIKRRWGVTSPAGVCGLPAANVYEVLMYAALGLFADSSSDPPAWAHVRYDAESERLQLAPSVATTRQLFADVVLVLAIIALARTWVRMMKSSPE